jgi:hypothetical protein
LRELLELLGFDQLFVGDFQDGARWLIRRWGEWYFGPTLGEWFAEAAFEVAETIYPTNTPWYVI